MYVDLPASVVSFRLNFSALGHDLRFLPESTTLPVAAAASISFSRDDVNPVDDDGPREEGAAPWRPLDARMERAEPAEGGGGGSGRSTGGPA